MINCLVVDDEPLAQEILEGYISGNPMLCLVAKCSTAFEAFEVLHAHNVELLFLDIKMPGLNGIDFIKSLKKPPAVIFTTAFSEYAAVSYDLDAIDYLLKPITLERFNKSLQKYLKSQSPIITEEKDYMYFKVSGKLIKVKHAEILFAQSVKDYIVVATITGNLITHMTMKYLCDQLPSDIFTRVHRSFLVNHTELTAVARNSVAIRDIKIPVGESYRNHVKRLRETIKS